MDEGIRKKVARSLIKEMKTSKISKEEELNIKGRILNIVLRGYDIPLQGGTTKNCKIKRVMPEPYFFERKGFHKLF